LTALQRGLRRYLDESDLQAIQRTKIGIAGAGGLGSNCAQLLARSGFIDFVLVDFDHVENSNLNRQFYFEDQISQHKVQSLADNLRRINPEVSIRMVQERITPENLDEFFADCDVVVEAMDTPECKQMLAESYSRSGKLLVAASGLAGWGDSDRIKVHRIHSRFYLIGDLTSGVEQGLPPMAPCVTIAAAKQADIVLSWVLGDLPVGKQGGA
jgi:sulfur carrier protein ThiS adenylyltransferase